MKIPASKNKLSINFKYTQVQGKIKGKNICVQGLYKRQQRNLQLRVPASAQQLGQACSI